MLNRIKKKQDFWKAHSHKYPHHVEHVKINIIAPEEYKHVRCISIPTGNRERIWGFKTNYEAQVFAAHYRHIVWWKYQDKNTMQELINKYVYVK